MRSSSEGDLGAVIFDFFGTLTVAARASERYQGHRRVAATLGIPVEQYAAALRDTWKQRAVAAFGDLPATLRTVAQRCGIDPDDETLAAACATRRAEQHNYLRLRPSAVDVLARLGGDGYRLGVVSDCTHELPEAWPTLPIAPYVHSAVFSVEVGSKKPDPAIFRLAAERLGVPPTACRYVGDGDSRELPGAAAVGMHPVRLLAPDHADAQVVEPIEWSGPTIAALPEVLTPEAAD